jgi:hypothetical protein
MREIFSASSPMRSRSRIIFMQVNTKRRSSSSSA